MTTKTEALRPGHPAGGLPASRRWLALAVLCISLLIVTLDNTVLNVVLPTLVRDLHATTSQLQWIVDAYVMVFAGLLLVAGSAADRVGRKRTFLAGLAAFAAGSTWAAFSGSVGMLIAARASMGAGAALIMPSTLSIITDMFRDGGERQRAIGLWAGTSGVGIALGPIIGGLLLAHFWWGSVFLVNVPIAAVGAAFAIRLVPDSKNPAASAPDLTGGLLSIAGLGLVLWSLIEAPVHGWSSALVIGAGVGGLAVLAVFALHERSCTHPMLNLEFFRRRQFSAAVTSVGLVTFGLFGALFILTQFMQFDLGYTPLQAGVRVLPAAGAIALVAPLSALLVRVAGTKLTAAAGMLAVAAGLWQFSGATVASTYTSMLPGMILLGIGAGLVIPSGTASVMGSLPREHTGVGSATNGTFLQVGGALGVAVLGSLLVTRYQGHITAALAPYHVPHAAMTTVLGSLGGALAVAARTGGLLGAALSHLARLAFISGMDLAMATGAAVALGGGLLALALLPARPQAVNRLPGGHQHGPEDGVAQFLVAVSMTAGRGRAARAVADAVGLRGDDVVLDIGCGPGTAVREAARRGARAIGVDPSPVMLRLARWISGLTRGRQVSWLDGRAEALPLPDDSASVVWALSSVHHWEDRAAGLREIRRVLRPGGRVLLVERLATPGAQGRAAHGLNADQADDLALDLAAAGISEVRRPTRRVGRRSLVMIQGTRDPGR